MFTVAPCVALLGTTGPLISNRDSTPAEHSQTRKDFQFQSLREFVSQNHCSAGLCRALLRPLALRRPPSQTTPPARTGTTRGRSPHSAPTTRKLLSTSTQGICLQSRATWRDGPRIFTLRNWHAVDGRRCPRTRELNKYLVQVDAQESIRSALAMSHTDSRLGLVAARAASPDQYIDRPLFPIQRPGLA